MPAVGVQRPTTTLVQAGRTRLTVEVKYLELPIDLLAMVCSPCSLANETAQLASEDGDGETDNNGAQASPQLNILELVRLAVDAIPDVSIKSIH